MTHPALSLCLSIEKVGLLNMSRGIGDGIAFASNQKHTVHPVTAGKRLSLVRPPHAEALAV